MPVWTMTEIVWLQTHEIILVGKVVIAYSVFEVCMCFFSINVPSLMLLSFYRPACVGRDPNPISRQTTVLC